mgnify:CR=1 FL=1
MPTPGEGAVCGVIVVGIKQAWVHGRSQRCGFSFYLCVAVTPPLGGVGEARVRGRPVASARDGVT